MDSARDSKTGRTTNISALLTGDRRNPGAWHKAKAEITWECPGCCGSAWMVRRNRDAGHFAGHHLSTDCPMDSERRVGTEPGSIDPRLKPVDNDGAVLQLRLEVPSATGGQVEVRADGNQPPGLGRSGRGLGGAERREARRKTQNLRVTLGHLMADEGYVAGLAEAGCRIEVPERGQVRPEDLFWAMDELDPRNEALVGRRVVVWGKVYSGNDKTDQKAGTGRGYLNQGPAGSNKGAVIVSAALAGELVRRYKGNGIDYFSEFRGWYVIALGKTERMGASQVAIRPLGASAVALRPAPR